MSDSGPVTATYDVTAARLRRQTERISAERRSALRLAFRMRLVAIAFAALYLLNYGFDTWQMVSYAAMVVLGLLGWLHYRVAGSDADHFAVSATLTAADYAIVFLLFAFPYLVEPGYPVEQAQFTRPYTWLMVLLVASAFFYRPADSIWSGLMAGLTWLGFLAFLASRPDALLPWSLAYPADLPMVEVMRLQEAAGALNVEAWIRESLVAVLVGIMLGAAVSRSRILLTRAMVAERARANLARYFSPAIVDHLEFRDDPLGTPRTGNVGVLFVDIVGFTRLVEQVTPAEVIELLRHFHALVASIVFLHNGTLDKYIGDAAMATFGTPSPMPDDAGRTLACAKALALAMDDWNGRRRAHGYPEVRIGIGAHYGVVVMGDIGDERRLEFAVLGDTVNVAARLEHLTRSIDARIVVSEALVEAAAREGGDLDALLAGFAPLDSQHLEGRDLPVSVRVSR